LKTDRRTFKAETITWVALALFTTVLILCVQLTGDQIWGKENTSLPGRLTVLLGYGLLSLSLSRLLSNTQLKHPLPYRVAFFLTLALGVLLLVLAPINGSSPLAWWDILLTSLGGFMGSFVASNQERRWWENNAPPSSRIEQEVLDFHKQFMGSRGKPLPFKRLFDITFASIALLLSLPVWVIVTIIIWWEDPGPILFVKNAVGRGGRNFKQLKFRSMVFHAEGDRGPIPITGYENDERVLSLGKFLRKTALDELPQLINILIGDMSTVGPRPQRTVLVHGYLQELPAYARRHQVRPGLAGLAQVVDAYDISSEEKLAWDQIYIQKANLWLDLKLLFSAFYLVFALRWTHDPHPEIRIRKRLGVVKPEIKDKSIKG
jgi:lipopolysaccharide/colanic/teichoic acid biosynthesis glycosyltransferase